MHKNKFKKKLDDNRKKVKCDCCGKYFPEDQIKPYLVLKKIDPNKDPEILN